MEKDHGIEFRFYNMNDNNTSNRFSLKPTDKFQTQGKERGDHS
jgi:hypothetical protein